MQREAPIRYRNGKQKIACGNCGLVQVETVSLTAEEYFNHEEYLDGFMVGLETKYFEYLFTECKECGNFASTIALNWGKYFEQFKIKEILDLEKPKIEKNLLIAHEINPTHQSLLNLYWYYDFNDKEEVKFYREKLIDVYKKLFKQEKSRYALRMLVELLRRNGDFKEAIKYAKKNAFLPNNITNITLKRISPFETEKIKLEIKLCKKQNSDRKSS